MIQDAAIILYDKSSKKILLQLRDSRPKLYPNYWSVFGGSVESGESFEQAAIREAREELKYNMKNPVMILENIEDENSPSPRHRQFFIEEYDSSLRLIICEGADMRWFNLHEFQHIKDKTIPGLVPLVIKVFEHLDKYIF